MAIEDYFDPYSFDEGQEVTCSRCGKAGLHWDDDGNGNFVLMETVYRIHKCDERVLHAQTADDFEVLDK